MTDPFEASVAAALRRPTADDPAELARLRAYAAQLPTRRPWFASGHILAVAGAIAAALLIAVLGLAWIGLPRPAGPQPPYPLITSDPRFSKCAGAVSDALAAFPMAHASDYRIVLPRMGKSPELESRSPAFVVIYRNPFRAYFLPLDRSPGPRPTLAPNHHDLCVWVGDANSGERWVFGDIDITGLSVPSAEGLPGSLIFELSIIHLDATTEGFTVVVDTGQPAGAEKLLLCRGRSGALTASPGVTCTWPSTVTQTISGLTPTTVVHFELRHFPDGVVIASGEHVADGTVIKVVYNAPATTPTPSSPLAPVSGWSEQVVDRSSQGIQIVGWSPDGSKFAVVGGQNVSSYTIQVFDRNGTLLRTFPGWIAAWTDDEHLVAAGGFDPPDANTPTWLRSVSGQGDRLLHTGVATLVGPNANGTVALVGATQRASPIGGDVFRVLRGLTLSGQWPGYVLGVSTDGTRLAYVADAQQVGKVGRGHLRVLDIATAESRDLGILAEEPGTAVLNADGSRLMTCVTATITDPTCHLAIIDSAKGSVIASSALDAGNGAWLSADTLLLTDERALYLWTIGSAPTKTDWQPATDGPGIEGIGAGRSTGVVLVPKGPDQASRSVADRDIVIVTAGLYAPHLGAYLDMNPDGGRVLFVRTSNNGVDQLVLAMLPS